jgi:hypothetical protein
MKIIPRILAILAAALVVAGATFVFAQSSAAPASFAEGPPPHITANRAADAIPSAGATDRTGEGARSGEIRHEEAHGPSLFGAVEITKSLAVMGGVIVVVSLGSRAWRSYSLKRRRQQQSLPHPLSPSE